MNTSKVSNDMSTKEYVLNKFSKNSKNKSLVMELILVLCKLIFKCYSLRKMCS